MIQLRSALSKHRLPNEIVKVIQSVGLAAVNIDNAVTGERATVSIAVSESISQR